MDEGSNHGGPIEVVRTDIRLLPDPGRVIVKRYLPVDEVFPGGRTRIELVVERILAMSDTDVTATALSILSKFSGRHRDLEAILEASFAAVADRIGERSDLSDDRRRLIGAYFTHEYSLEAAALTNPSIVPHPDQEGLRPGETRFIISLRAIGEGHISSIEFRSGVIGADGTITLAEPNRHTTTAERRAPLYDKKVFVAKLTELGIFDETARSILDLVSDRFLLNQLEEALATVGGAGASPPMTDQTVRTIHWLASSNYESIFDSESDISHRVIFPAGPTESQGMEDARFVRFTHDDGSVLYYATYTAYDGYNILPQVIETENFLSFRIATLFGDGARNKGIAIFPKMINGKYAALSRQDNENNYLMLSENVRQWHTSAKIQVPTRPWELMHIGNCGSPLETEAGWLVITHGVGPMRQYSLGAILLDRDEPWRVIGHLEEPLLTPDDSERNGYVPNVVYSCGSMIHNQMLVLPYGFSDVGSRIALVPLDNLLGRLAG
ncbi:MAG: glycoside hydrolase family 130 protein [Acidimicrobiia bacterium]